MQSIENCLIQLNSIRGSNTYYGEKAGKLIDWYNETGGLSKKQVEFASHLIRRAKNEKSRGKEKEHYLYAISDGKNVKIGFSVNPKYRRSALQTASPVRLEIIWTLAVGYSRMIAEKQERKLHRYCRKFRKQGEWFGIGCMHLVEQFHVKQKAIERREQESFENHLVIEAMQRL